MKTNIKKTKKKRELKGKLVILMAIYTNLRSGWKPEIPF